MKLSCVALFVLGVSVVAAGGGCGERGTAAPRIESLGPSPPRAERRSLRIATANLWGVVALGFDWADHIDERFAEFGARLAAGEPDLDVVLIQEAWKDSTRRALLEAPGVVRRFPHRVDVVSRPGGAGLVLLSAFPIEEVRFHRFRTQGVLAKVWEADAIAGKGVLAARLRVDGHPLWVADVHLIACYGKDEAPGFCDGHDPNSSYRAEQITELRSWLEELAGDLPVVVGGDFNFVRGTRHHVAMTAPQPVSPGSPTARAWRDLAERETHPERIDYFFVRDGSHASWRPAAPVSQIFEEPLRLPSGELVPLSDHPVLFVELRRAPVAAAAGG